MQNLKTVDFGVAFTLTRPAPADYEDKDGNTQTAAANEPRFNYSNGVAQGLLLDASLSETAAIDDVPLFNSSAGHWIIDGEFFNSEPLPGMGLNERFSGSGKMVVSYSGGTAKVWAGGQAIYAVASYTPAEPTHICEGGMAIVGGLTYKPSAISDADAASLATGDFQLAPFDPLRVFVNGTKGAWYDSTDSATLFTDSAGTTAAMPGDPCGRRLDKSGNDNDQYQTTTAAKPTVQIVSGSQMLALDGIDDAMIVDVPAGGWSGTFVQGTALGVIVGEIYAPEGAYQIPTDPDYEAAGSDIETIIVNRFLENNELQRLIEWVEQRCPESDFSSVDRFDLWFRARSDFTSLDFSRWDVSGADLMTQMLLNMSQLKTVNVSGWDVTNVSSLQQFIRTSPKVESLDISTWNPASCQNFREFMRGLPLVTEIDLSNWTTPAMTDCRGFAQDCESLSNVTINGGSGSVFSDSQCTQYQNAFLNTSLNQQSYTDILVAIESANSSGGSLDITGGSATTTGAAKTAVDSLRGRGWTITTPDGY